MLRNGELLHRSMRFIDTSSRGPVPKAPTTVPPIRRGEDDGSEGIPGRVGTSTSGRDHIDRGQEEEWCCSGRDLYPPYAGHPREEVRDGERPARPPSTLQPVYMQGTLTPSQYDMLQDGYIHVHAVDICPCPECELDRELADRWAANPPSEED